jgi:hypothetical protein
VSAFPSTVLEALRRPARGVIRAVRARPGTFVGVALAILALDVMLPPLLLSVIRGPWTYFTFNPWLKKLPEYLMSSAPLSQKLDFVSRVAIFWFSADGPYGAPEWGFAVDTLDLVRFVMMASLFGAYFALWRYRRTATAPSASRHRIGGRPAAPDGHAHATMRRGGGTVGVLTSVIGLSTGPCSVVGCGAPVLPVVGLVFAGLSSGTLALLSGLSRIATAVLFVVLAAGVAYLGWSVGANRRSSVAAASASGFPKAPGLPTLPR